MVEDIKLTALLAVYNPHPIKTIKSTEIDAPNQWKGKLAQITETEAIYQL